MFPSRPLSKSPAQMPAEWPSLHAEFDEQTEDTQGEDDDEQVEDDVVDGIDPNSEEEGVFATPGPSGSTTRSIDNVR